MTAARNTVKFVARAFFVPRRLTISDAKPPHLIKIENERLRARISELEKELEEAKVGGSGTSNAGDGGIDRRFTQLIRKKNQEIEESHEELKARALEAQNAADELRIKNEELTNNMAVLRLYQLMFESDPNGLIGVSPGGQIIQFNSSAIRYFGYDLHKMRMQNIAGLKMPDTDVDLHAIFKDAMQGGESAGAECKQQDKQVAISCFRLEDIRGERGVVFRFSDVVQ